MLSQPPSLAEAPLSRAEERAMLTVTGLAAFLFFNSFGSIGVALPAIQRQFGNSLAELQWVTLMGVVTISSLSFCFGRAGGIFGQRRLYKLGVAFYAAGAGLGALAGSFAALLCARAVMAVGLAMALPMSTAILAASFAASRRGRALGFFASAIAVGRMSGPTVGGFLLQAGGWRWIFWMNFLVGVAVTLAVTRIFRGAGARRTEPFDLWGSLALLIGYPALLIGLTFGTKVGWSAPLVLMAFVIGLCGLSLFFVVELRVAKPLVDMAIFRRGRMAVAQLVNALTHMLHQPLALCAPLYLQNVLGASAVEAGVLLAILPLSTALASPLSGRLADRYDSRRIASVGVVTIVAGVALYSRLDADASFWGASVVLALIGCGIGCFTPANQKMAFTAVTQEDYGVLAAMLSSFGTAAGTIGITLAVALMESDGGDKLWSAPASFAGAQQFAFAWLLPIGLLAIAVAFGWRRGDRWSDLGVSGAKAQSAQSSERE